MKLSQMVLVIILSCISGGKVFAGGSGYEPGNTNFKNLMKCEIKNEKNVEKKWVTFRQAVFKGQYSGSESWQEIIIPHTPESKIETEYQKNWKIFRVNEYNIFIGSEPLNGADMKAIEMIYENFEISVTGVSYDAYVKVDVSANEEGGYLKSFLCGDDYNYKKCEASAFVDLPFSRCIPSI